MKLISLALFFLLCCYSLMAQNLVPNPSFEDYTDCPWDPYQVYLCKGWNSYRRSPDYYNRCTTNSILNVPNNWMGNQEPASGDAYIGILTFEYSKNLSSKNFREIIGCKLLTPLQQEMKYYVSIKVSLGEFSAFATDKLGIAFSTVPYMEEYDSTDYYPAPLINRAIVYSSSIITDTVNWITISGSFIADSVYQYIMIGNLFDDAHIDTFRIRNNNLQGYYYSYYYIDDICLSEDSSICNSITAIKTLSPSKFTIYPNPANSKIYINTDSDIEYAYSLYSLLGNKINSSMSKGSTTINISELPSGIYFLEIQQSNTIIQFKQLIVRQ